MPRAGLDKPVLRQGGVGPAPDRYQPGIGPLTGVGRRSTVGAWVSPCSARSEVDGQVNGLSPRDRVVLSALVVRAGEPISTEALADALWGDQLARVVGEGGPGLRRAAAEAAGGRGHRVGAGGLPPRR